MAPKQEQEVLLGVPGPAKRKVIPKIEDKCLERDKHAGKRTAISDKIAEIEADIQADIVAAKLDLYTYENSDGVLQDVFNEMKLKKRKSKLNPKKAKKGDE